MCAETGQPTGVSPPVCRPPRCDPVPVRWCLPRWGARSSAARRTAPRSDWRSRTRQAAVTAASPRAVPAAPAREVP
ncbi:hypothetical protein DF19_07715 [Streptomyces olindensis]|nr:hypothetical protein DF19_07715 [Streptomyces olindensis]